MKTLHRSAAALVLGCVLWLAQPGLLFAEVRSAALSRGQNLVEGHQYTIALFMHPTAGLRSIEYQSCTELESGNFQLEYAFNFRAWYGLAFYSNLRFTYFANGTLDYVSLGDRNAVIPPFFASNLVLQWVKDRVTADPEIRSDQDLGRLMANFDSRQLLEWWLKSGH